MSTLGCVLNYHKLNFCSLFAKVSALQLLTIQQVPVFLDERHASKSAGNRVSQKEPSPGKRRGVKRVDGECVRANEVLVKQYNLNYLPGLNVSVDKERTLLSDVDGTVVVTCEKMNPKWDHELIQKYFGKNPAPFIYRKYFHVVPFPQGKKFHLVELV